MSRQLVTCFKNKSPTFFTFRKFYFDYWNIDIITYCIGYTSNDNYEYIKKHYIYELDNHKSIGNLADSIQNVEVYYTQSEVFLLYFTPDNESIALSQWDSMKGTLMRYYYKHLYKDTTFIITIDNDEFLYKSDIRSINDTQRFHYLEILLEDTFDINNDLEWCIQSWSNIKYFIQKRRQQDCTSCKTFNFNFHNNKYRIDRSLMAFKHSGKDLLFNDSSCRFVKDKSIDLQASLETGVCFHFLGFTKNHLVSSKQNRWRNDWGSFFEQNEILRSAYGSVVCNVLKEYIDPKDFLNV